MSPAAVEAASFADVVTLEPQDTLPVAAAVVVAAVAGWLAMVVEEPPLPPQPASGTAMATAALAGSAQSLFLRWVYRANMSIRMRSRA